MKKVIVLGSNGQLGRSIKNLIYSYDFEFYFYSRRELDITDNKSLSREFKKYNFNYCINCAAYTNVEGAETNVKEAFLINAKGARNIAKVCVSNNVKLIHISTDYVFDGEKGEPYKTDDVTQPINQYGKSKLQGEIYIQDLLNEHFIIRTSWLYSLYGRNFLKTIISKIENDEVLNITTEEEGTPTNCRDLSEFILDIIETEAMPYGIYNFSAQGSTTWYGFAQEIVKNHKPEKIHLVLPTGKFKTQAKRPKYSVFDLSKTEELYRPLETWKISLNRMFSDN